jgi:hypothetical protein
MHEIPSQYLTHIALAALFHDAVRFYDRDDSAAKQLSGKSSSENKESIDQSAAAIMRELNGVLSGADLLAVAEMIKTPWHPLGRYVHFADAVELCNPIRNSCVAYEHRVARKAGSWWVRWKYYKVFIQKTKDLLSSDAHELGATLASIETLLYKNEVLIDSSQPECTVGTGAHLGVQSLLFESKGSFGKWLAGFDLFGKHDNRLREMSMDSMKERTRKDLRRLRWMLRNDKPHCCSIRALERGGRLNRNPIGAL